MNSPRPSATWSWPVLSLLLLAQLWTAHAVVFFAHEYAHTSTAWLLGWKSNPLALNYSHPTLKVLLAQMGIDQDVNEAPIFASGHGRDAAFIAAAGMVIGNGLITYPLSRLGAAIAARRNLRGWAMFFYWTTVASVGNFIDYVPVRTFSPTGDMKSLALGLGWSPWTVLVVLGIPTACALLYFLVRIQTASVSWLFPDSAPRRGVMVVLTGAVLWGFYGAAGLVEGGPSASQMSKVSVFVLLPLVTLASWFLVQRRASDRTI
jgi:hypothetical protein